MALQEILSLGLGGAAVATLYIFNVSYILLAISCLFLVHTTSKLFIREPSEEFEEEKHINIKTIIEDSAGRPKYPILKCQTTDEIAESDFEALEDISKPNETSKHNNLGKPDWIEVKAQKQDMFYGGRGSTYNSEASTNKDEINRPNSKTEKTTTHHMDEKITTGNFKEHLFGLNAESAQPYLNLPEVMPQKENGNDESFKGTGNTKTSMITTKKKKYKDGTNEDTLYPTTTKGQESTPKLADTKKNEEELGTISKDLEKVKSITSASIPEDTGCNILDFMERVGLDNFYPNRLQLMDVMTIRAPVKVFELKDVALKFAKNIIMMNYTCRDQMLHEFLEHIKVGKKELGDDRTISEGYSFDNILNDIEYEDETELNPLDLLFALFKSCSPMLKQILANKLFMSKLAIPFILPKFGNEPLEMCLWPLRSIILERKLNNGSCQDMSVECPCEIVSFVRIGRSSVSKSKLLNEILTDQYHNTFSNKDCPLGTSKRIISDGIVEAAWYIPSNKSKILTNTTMFLNLRGDAVSHAKQLEGISQISDILVVVILLCNLEDKVLKKLLNNILTTNKGVVLAIDASQDKKTVVRQKLVNFTKSVENNKRMNICILSVDGQMRSTADITSEMRTAIAAMMTKNVEQSLYYRLSKCHLRVDEEDVVHRNARQNALRVFNDIPNDCLNVKETVVPLQGKTWAAWCQKLKNVCKSSQYKTSQEEGSIKMEMIEDRKKQMKICENLGPLIKTFLSILLKSINSHENCTVFVLWLKNFLDQRSRSVLPGFLSKYQNDWQKLKTSRDKKENAAVIKRFREALDTSEYNLAEASFGFEHLCREMGQIFESIDQCKPKANSLMKLGNALPRVAAELLVMGQPFEIMDGDVANVPLIWVKAVLEQVKLILGDKRLLALSVLGIQSSGKSTFLNTMFGLQFAVSAGRCTRGVFIQLVPVSIEKSKYDFVLVIDTEGLRAPELANQKQSHDNELATFVIGLGDITVVNIKGENTAEMKDVLQIAVHACLRLKLANEKLNLKQTCIFVHQNVPASDANDKMMQGRQKFVEVLDEMTREAAEQENMADIQSFNQVIEFDSEKNVWYFSDLWHGDPPMAPANPGYSESVCKVKEAIMFRLPLARDTYLTITDTSARIEDLWNGILKDDFVFSFRNSLELKAYNSMGQQCQTITWKLEKYVLEFINSDAKSKLVSCGNNDDLENAVPRIMMQLSKEVAQRVKDFSRELDLFVEESTLKDIMIQWKQSKRNKLMDFGDSLVMKAKMAINSTKEELRIKKLRVNEKTKHEIQINNMAKQLALQMKGQVPSEKVLREKFNGIWNSWINQFASNDIKDIVPIQVQVESILCELFPADATFMDCSLDGKQCFPKAKVHQNLGKLLGTLTVDHILPQQHLSIHKKTVVVKMARWFGSSSDKSCKHQAIDFTNMIFRKIDLKLAEHNSDGLRFDTSYVRELLHIVRQEIDGFNSHTSNDYKFNLLSPFRVMILNHVGRYAASFFTRLHENYNKKHSPKAQMEEYKGTAWEMFKNTVDNKTEDVIALGFFRDAMVNVVVDQVSECLPIDAQESIQILFANGKYSLVKDILIDLATADDFDEYKSFILDPYTFAKNWIRKLLESTLFENSTGMECLYTKSAKSRISRIFSHISKCIADATEDSNNDTSSCISKWIDAFVKHNCKSPDLPLSNDVFVHVRDRKISIIDTFASMLKEELPAIELKVVRCFSNIDSDTVQWKKNPVPHIMDSLWGCSEKCMFCKEPCMNTNKDHLADKFSHKCLQHRPNGIGGFRSSRTQKMVVDFCNYLVSTDRTYDFKSKDIKGEYKKYKEHFPDWDIPPNSDVSKYWMWVMCKYKDELTTMYDTVEPDIPENWLLISKEEALNSL